MANMPPEAAPVHTHSGGAFENVEILHKAVEAFRRRELGYREILEDLPAAIYTTDADGRITYFNRACTEFSGRTPRLGDDLWCVTWKLYTRDGEPLAHSDCPMAVALREGRPVRGVEASAERPDGSRVDFLPYPTPIFDSEGVLLGAVNMLVDITEQKRARARLEDMARQVDHRANNLLAVMQGLLRLTRAETVEGYREALDGRFGALARANALIADGGWSEVDLLALAEAELQASGASAASIDGASLPMRPSSAQCLGLLLHELATNAVRHGALSAPGGAVAVAWRNEGGALVLRWEESAAPPAGQPAREGTGAALIAGAARQLGGSIDRRWSEGGLRVTLRCPAGEL